MLGANLIWSRSRFDLVAIHPTDGERGAMRITDLKFGKSGLNTERCTTGKLNSEIPSNASSSCRASSCLFGFSDRGCDFSRHFAILSAAGTTCHLTSYVDPARRAPRGTGKKSRPPLDMNPNLWILTRILCSLKIRLCGAPCQARRANRDGLVNCPGKGLAPLDPQFPSPDHTIIRAAPKSNVPTRMPR